MDNIQRNFKLYTEFLARIEKECDTSALTYKKLKIWPFIRLKLWAQLSHPESHFIHKIKLPLLDYKYELPESDAALLTRLNKPDITFFSTPAVNFEQMNGKYYNPFVDPIIELFYPSCNFLKLEMYSTQPQEKMIRFFPSTIIKCFPTNQLEINEDIPNFKNFSETVFKITKIEVEKSFCQHFGHKIDLLHEYFINVLSLINPKAVLLVCYYDLTSMSMIHACKALSIPTADIQHGICGINHGMYTHWTRIPENGYDLLPDYFWCWGKIFQSSIEKWQPEGCKHHRPIVGGNLRFHKWFNKSDPITDEHIENFYKRLLQKKKVILVSLQDVMTLPDFLMQTAAKTAPYDWFWLFRMHPVYKNEQTTNQLRDIFQEYKLSNCEFYFATQCPLYGLLKRIHHHITSYSAVFYEALVFNIPTTIIDNVGRELFQNELKNGSLYYADTIDTLLTSIEQGSTLFEKVDPSDYIETCVLTTEKALENITNLKFRKFGERKNSSPQFSDLKSALDQAITLFFAKKYDEAFDIYEKLIVDFPKNALNILNVAYKLYEILSNEDRYCLYQSRFYDFGIMPYDKVLDIGSGNIPFKYATHLADLSLDDGSIGRANSQFKYINGKQVFQCDIENMLFKDNEFDFVYCSHVLEHVQNPEKACKELIRVGKRGFIDTPTKGKDIWLNTAKISNHRWWIEKINEKLIFTKYKKRELSGFESNILLSMHSQPQTPREKAFSALIYLKADLVNNMLLWDSSFEYEVRS